MVHLNYLRNSALAYFRILFKQNSAVFSSHFVSTRDSRILQLEERALKAKRDYHTISVKTES